MCLILTLVMLILSIQNLFAQAWLTGGIQLIIALGFSLFLLRNIRLTHCRKNGNFDDFCILPDWITKRFRRK